MDSEQTHATRSAVSSALVQSTLLGELLEHAQIGVIAVDEGHYVAANEYACELSGFTREELIGRRVGELSPFSAIPHQASEVASGLRDSGDVIFRRKDGSELHVRYRAVETTLAGMPLFIGLFWPV